MIGWVKVYAKKDMNEPFYTHNGKTMSYVPIEVKTHRDAYAATLHVLFKHIADFHLCVVKTFSKKYGIPEDDIIQTIQESPEFKNMEIDPALHTVHDAIESMGYKNDVITTPPDTIPKKRIVKKKHTAADTDVTITKPETPVPIQAPIQAPIQEKMQEQNANHATVVAKKRVVKKKQVQVSETVAVASETVTVASETVASERETDYFQPPASAQVDVPDKKKVIKKTTAKIQCIDPTQPHTPAPLVVAPVLQSSECVKQKIIKKLKTT